MEYVGAAPGFGTEAAQTDDYLLKIEVWYDAFRL
jgi:hypothetical protein